MASLSYPTLPGAKPSAQSVPVVLPTDDLLRLRSIAPRLRFGGTASTAGDQTTLATGAILAPPAGQRIVITYVICQTVTATAVTVLLKEGTVGAVVLPIVCGAAIGSGMSQPFVGGDSIRLAAATPLVPNLSIATPVRIAGFYYLENVTTGVPV